MEGEGRGGAGAVRGALKSGSSTAGGAETVIKGFFALVLDLSTRLGIADAVALCATLNGLETSKDTDFCVRSVRCPDLVELPAAELISV